ncbi:MAG TPA: ANTAR domain-containing protein [Gaiellaceae bacterium]|nr:ANTAR domain-containing protein [Gaiellaceae bacterium]
MSETAPHNGTASGDVLAQLSAVEAENAQLRQALESRVVIEQAKGVLHERFGWEVDDAFEVLRYAARSARRDLHSLAAEVVNAEATPNPVVVALARSTRWRAARMREHAEAQRDRAHQLEVRIHGMQERLMATGKA